MYSIINRKQKRFLGEYKTQIRSHRQIASAVTYLIFLVRLLASVWIPLVKTKQNYLLTNHEKIVKDNFICVLQAEIFKEVCSLQKKILLILFFKYFYLTDGAPLATPLPFCLSDDKISYLAFFFVDINCLLKPSYSSLCFISFFCE